MTERKRESRILSEMHATMRGLDRAGLIDKRHMRELDVLIQAEVKPLKSSQIKSMREGLRLSQAVFASLLNISPSTVQKWEAGQKSPSGPSLKLLNLVKARGLEALA